MFNLVQHQQHVNNVHLLSVQFVFFQPGWQPLRQTPSWTSHVELSPLQCRSLHLNLQLGPNVWLRHSDERGKYDDDDEDDDDDDDDDDDNK